MLVEDTYEDFFLKYLLETINKMGEMVNFKKN